MNIIKLLIAVIFTIASLSVNAKNVNAKTSGFAVDVASNHIDITVGFDGSSIELFGDRRDKKAVVAIVVEGPKRDITIWQKAKIMGTWVNRHYVTFKEIPTYYNYAISSDKINKPLSDVMMKNAIGHKALFNKVNSDENKKRKNINIFENALLKKNYKQGTFFEDSAKINFINDNFFRVSFSVPPSAPTGTYKIHSFLIKNGKVADHLINNLKVEQVGLNAFIYKSAKEYSLTYALVCIVLALFSGWLVSSVRII